MKVEWHDGDLADLAFLRADSIDVAFSASSGRRGRRRVPPVPPGAPGAQAQRPRSCSRTRTRCRCASTPTAWSTRSYFDPGPIDVERDGEAVRIHIRDVGDVFTELGRAGFRVDTMLEPRPGHARCPGARRPSSGAPARKAPDPTSTPSVVRARSALAGPGVEAGVGLVLADRALVEAGLEEEVERLADDPARARRRGAPSPAGRRAAAGSRRAPPARAARRCGARARPCAAAAPAPGSGCGSCSRSAAGG